ncbi:MAG: YggS family pyridoxal phosphate-dependent enzyme [Weeksellaceae bacterium]|jgi:pyridoxal phosphate enzyme (YggS family)|nr:YggS family pyridoxal phosphate-dependent enzyme [Weeksellaceae bacterium]MDX9704278.1 YggS family pyridoxal phosphate-dependent enzyme [Weeksellaceae bacterium]
MSISENLHYIQSNLPENVRLIAVSKTKPVEAIQALYEAGHRDFGENRVQELTEKQKQLPQDIHWHLIGHLQKNKVKYIAPFIHLIHSVDNESLLKEINKQAKKNQRTIPCLLQIYIAEEESKFGLNKEEAHEILLHYKEKYTHVKVVGLMGMATFTDDISQIRSEFNYLKNLFDEFQSLDNSLQILSMGMSGDYPIAIEEGSNLVRIGSLIFGERIYP